ncbi:unnamed protein product [Bursaphelenchus xylophilus]|uniref:GATOR2 complex protein WDR24 n=1 Tax=Bursaphelenchus xylophilus TaxID=6326 RepID=A0A7I8WUG0_BURXY|nr:unnamed protein product [Bursaphelenchus xylophilus]CAG9116503.1 unnamed protein product [Bursaphelenchus xylophilus]
MGVHKDVTLELNDPMDSLSVNKDFTQIAVAGRAVLKVFSIKEDGFEPAVDLRAKTRRMNLYFSGSVSWNPNRENLIAVTSSIGSIVLFDLEHCHGSNPQDAVSFIDPESLNSGLEFQFRAHKAAATKVCFHEFNQNLFISGSKDATLFLYDIRKPEPAGHFVPSGGSMDTIRDVMFGLDTQSQDMFVTGDDSGAVRFWDIRRSDRCLKETLAHQGPVSAVSLNPTLEYRHLIATAGRDRYVRVWDWTSDSSDFLYLIETPSALNRVKWDIDKDHHLVTVAATESQVFSWDVRRPFFPYSCFGTHDFNVSDISFPRFSGLNRFVTCGKDRKLSLHYSESGDMTISYHRPFAMADSNPFNEIICALPEGCTKGVFDSEYQFEGPVKSALLQYQNPPVALTGSNKFSELAKHYRFLGDNPMNICNHNAEAARKCGDVDLSYTWKVVGVLLNEGKLFKPTNYYDGKDRFFEYIQNPEVRRDRKEQVEEIEDSSDDSDVDENLLPGTFSQSLQDALSSTTDFFFGSGEFCREGLPCGKTFVSLFEAKHARFMKSDLRTIGSEAVNFNRFKNGEDAATEVSLNDEDNVMDSMSTGKLDPVLFEDSENDDIEDHQDEDNLDEDDEQTEGHIPLQLQVAEKIEDGQLQNPLTPLKDVGVSNFDSTPTGISNSLLNITSVHITWGPVTRLSKLMNLYTDICDSQTCATVCLVMGSKAKELFGDEQVTSWFMHYIEQLQNAGFGDLATFIAKNSGCEEVLKTLQENMHVKVYCGNCDTPAPVASESCPKCGTTFIAICTVCDNEVKGMFAQCKDCGHGGHEGHLEEWFKNFGVCPFPGCEHICVMNREEDEPEVCEVLVEEAHLVAQSGLVDSNRKLHYRAENGLIVPLEEAVYELADDFSLLK